VADLVGVAGARAQPQGQVPAEIGADGAREEPGPGQRPAVAGPAAGPGRQRAEEQRRRPRLADGVHQADPLLVLVQRRPVGEPGGCRGHGCPDSHRDQDGRRALGAVEQVEEHRRGPAAERQPDQRGVRRLPERHAVQRVRPRAGRQRADHGIGQAADDGIEGVGALDALGQHGRPGQQGALAVLARTPGCMEKGLPHV
jgi:hypothetical protein